MSLWQKPIENVTIQDIDNFLSQKQKEGLRLDYKADFPADLAKLVSAFANTMGGLVVLGVAADQTTNEPIWPPPSASRGLPTAKGLDEKIVAICRDNIYPPVLPHLSPIISNPHLPAHDLVVVRVDESREAPHAVDGGRKIYERTGSQGKPYESAHVDRIQYLMKRRERIEQEREMSINAAIERGMNALPRRTLETYGNAPPLLLPARWVSIIPYYPWRELCTAEACYQLTTILPGIERLQRAPGGAFCTCVPHHSNQTLGGRGSITAKGHVFAIEQAAEALVDFERTGGTSRFLALLDTQVFLSRVLDWAKKFYEGPAEIPGHLLFTLGFSDVRGFSMFREVPVPKKGQAFPDAAFRAEVVADAVEFLGSPAKVEKTLMGEVMFGFDLLGR